MRTVNCVTQSVFSAIVLLLTSISAFADTTGVRSVLHAFPAGEIPSGLIQASDGAFFGTVSNDGSSSNGYVFRLSTDGTFNIIHSFTGAVDGGTPQAGLIEGNDGNLYGTNTTGGGAGNGVLFSLTSGGAITVLHEFSASDGIAPGSLIQTKAGDFFGTARGGESDFGTVFEYSHAGVFSVVHAFTESPDGAYPNAPLLQASDGLIYGVTEFGGDIFARQLSGTMKDTGTIFRFNPQGPAGFTTVASFPFGLNAVGGSPLSYVHPQPTFGLTEGADHLLYGMTTQGGGGELEYSPAGTIYTLSMGNLPHLSEAYDFSPHPNLSDHPVSGLTLGGDGNFYGTSTMNGPFGDGGVFRFGGGSRTSLYYFGDNEISTALGAPIVGSDGNLYGVTALYGNSGSLIYKLVVTPAIPPPVMLTAKQSSVTLGKGVALTWQVTNAFSKTAQNCYAHGDWSGSRSATGSTLLFPRAAGTYTYALTCGGVESASTIVTVHPQPQ